MQNISFLNKIQHLTVYSYNRPIVSEIDDRIAALCLSPAAALDITVHSFSILYALGKRDLPLAWAHLQRVQNAVTPLFLGSVFGLIHPFAGLVVSEPTDKQIIFGILSSNTSSWFETPCSPIQSLSIVEGLGIFTDIIKETKEYEKSLKILQAQEYIHKITNVTLYAMSHLTNRIQNLKISDNKKEILTRLSGVFIPVLTTVDITITLIAQTFFLTTGVLRMVSGRGPIYTEVTTNPLMHLSFLIQSLLKSTGNIVCTFVWFVSPFQAFKNSLLPANTFFRWQMNSLLNQIRKRMIHLEENTRFVIPIVYGLGECTALSIPTHTTHKTYLIVEKKNQAFNLHWVNRPKVSLREGLDLQTAMDQIKIMLEDRFPFMDIQKVLNYPITSKEPQFFQTSEQVIQGQGNQTNCVVSNLFAAIETLDRLAQSHQCNYQEIRKTLMTKYSFYKNDYSLLSPQNFWETFEKYPDAPI